MNERFHEAEKLVGIIYNKDPTLKNGYAFIGWYFFQKKNHFDKSLFFFQKDIVLERLAEDKLWQYALLLAVHGDILKSTQIIDRIKINSEKVRFCKFVTRLYYDNYIEQSLLKHSIKILEQMQAKDFYRIDITKNLVLQYYFNNQVDNAIQLIEWWEKKHDLQDKYFPRLTFSLYVLLDNNKEYSENLIKEISLEQLTDVRSLLTFSIILSVIGKLDELKESINTLYCRYPNCFIELPSWCLLFSLAAYRFKNEKLFDTYLEIGNKYKHSFSSRIDWINSIKFDLDKLFWPLPSFRLPNADFQI